LLLSNDFAQCRRWGGGITEERKTHIKLTKMHGMPMKIVKRCCIVRLQLHGHPLLTPDPQRSLNDTHRKGSTEIACYNAHTHTGKGGVALHNFSFAVEALKSQRAPHFPHSHSSAEQNFPLLFRCHTHINTHMHTALEKRKSHGKVERAFVLRSPQNSHAHYVHKLALFFAASIEKSVCRIRWEIALKYLINGSKYK